MRSMKNSGVPWLGAIPADWDMSKTKYFYSTHKSIAGIKSADYERLALTMKGVIKRSKADDTGLQPDNFDTYQILQRGELVFKLIDLQNVSTSRVGLSPYTGLVSPAYIILTPSSDVVSEFGQYYFLSLWHREIFNHLGDEGVRSSLSTKDLLEVPYPILDISEQHRIADFLNLECSKVDALVADVQKEIDVLDRYKRSVITEAVTKGLDRNVTMRDSGIEWVGQIPEHWTTSRLGYESYIRARLGWKGLKAEEYVDEGYAFISAFNIQDDLLVWTPLNYITEERYLESPEIQIHVGDILIVKDGAGVGKTARVDSLPVGETAPNSSIGVITPYCNLNYKYCSYYLQSSVFKNFVLRLLNGMGVPHLTQEVLKNIKILVPPLSEQNEIASYLDHKCSEIYSVIERKRKQLSVLDAYKKSIIFEYVTGKKEVP